MGSTVVHFFFDFQGLLLSIICQCCLHIGDAEAMLAQLNVKLC